jgi:hypothetical protein
MRIFEHKIKRMLIINIFRSHESIQPYMTSTTEIAAQVVEELDKPI